jgi:hypothetical protein
MVAPGFGYRRMATISMVHDATDEARREPEARDSGQQPAYRSRMPLTQALLDVAARGVSFATPGHRGGRSCAPQQ